MIGRSVGEPERTLRLVVTVEDLWREVQPVRPHDGSGIGTQSDLAEVLRIVQGRQHLARHLSRYGLDVANKSVIEQEPDHMRAEHGDGGDRPEVIGRGPDNGSTYPDSALDSVASRTRSAPLGGG